MKKLALPTNSQLKWHEAEIGMFYHWKTTKDTTIDVSGLADYHAPLDTIDPDEFDAENWLQAAKNFGAKYAIIVAKHFSGFCLWPTSTGDYSVKNIKWKDGKGDMVKEFFAACKKFDIKPAVYCSPADRYHGATVGGVCSTPQQQEKYDKVFHTQLCELLDNYGEAFELWLDGHTQIDMSDITAKHSDMQILNSQYATIRWSGNEAGTVVYPCWNSVKTSDFKEAIVCTNRHGSPDGDRWMPVEADTPARNSWFYLEDNEDSLHSLEEMLGMYYQSQGNGAGFLMNCNPTPGGKVPDKDMLRYKEFGDEVNRRFGKGREIAEVSFDGSEHIINFEKPTKIDHIILQEDIAFGERVRNYEIEILVGSEWRLLCAGSAIGYKRIEHFNSVEADSVKVVITKFADIPKMKSVRVFFTNVEPRNYLKIEKGDNVVGGWIGMEDYPYTPTKEQTYDITSVCDAATEYGVRFVQTALNSETLMDDLKISDFELICDGMSRSDYCKRINDMEFEFTLPGIFANVSIFARFNYHGYACGEGNVIVYKL